MYVDGGLFPLRLRLQPLRGLLVLLFTVGCCSTILAVFAAKLLFPKVCTRRTRLISICHLDLSSNPKDGMM